MEPLQSNSWAIKYAPKTLETYIFDEQQKKHIDQIISNKLDAHVLLSGIQGTGKTTLSNIIINELNIDDEDILILNASDENSVDVVREKIIDFVSIMPNGDFRVVQLEEADYLSQNAQAILRKVLEDYESSCRFIITCNYDHKIIPALKSRCRYQFQFKSPSKNSILAHLVKNILLPEKIDLSLPDAKENLTKIVDGYYPDIRKIIQVVQMNCINGSLELLDDDGTINDFRISLIDLMEKNDWKAVRESICENVNDNEMEDVYRLFYENLDKCEGFEKYSDKWKEGQIIIAEHLYRNSSISDREINLSTMIIRLWGV